MHDQRLLILDDDPAVGRILELAARSAGAQAHWCEEVDDFLVQVAEWRPTHVAVDMLMPGTSGEEVLKRRARDGCQAQVIVSSGLGAQEIDAVLDEAQALGLRTAGALPKPFTLAAVRSLLAVPKGG